MGWPRSQQEEDSKSRLLKISQHSVCQDTVLLESGEFVCFQQKGENREKHNLPPLPTHIITTIVDFKSI